MSATERHDAIALANKVLDRVNADPDDDLAMLARSLLRETERDDGTKRIFGGAKTMHKASSISAGHVHEAVMRAEEIRDEYLRGKGWKCVCFKATWLWEKTIDGRTVLLDGGGAYQLQAGFDDIEAVAALP